MSDISLDAQYASLDELAKATLSWFYQPSEGPFSDDADRQLYRVRQNISDLNRTSDGQAALGRVLQSKLSGGLIANGLHHGNARYLSLALRGVVDTIFINLDIDADMMQPLEGLIGHAFDWTLRIDGEREMDFLNGSIPDEMLEALQAGCRLDGYLPKRDKMLWEVLTENDEASVLFQIISYGGGFGVDTTQSTVFLKEHRDLVIQDPTVYIRIPQFSTSSDIEEQALMLQIRLDDWYASGRDLARPVKELQIDTRSGKLLSFSL